jgi:hypothetical protein
MSTAGLRPRTVKPSSACCMPFRTGFAICWSSGRAPASQICSQSCGQGPLGSRLIREPPTACRGGLTPGSGSDQGGGNRNRRPWHHVQRDLPQLGDDASGSAASPSARQRSGTVLLKRPSRNSLPKSSRWPATPARRTSAHSRSSWLAMRPPPSPAPVTRSTAAEPLSEATSLGTQLFMVGGGIVDAADLTT